MEPPSSSELFEKYSSSQKSALRFVSAIQSAAWKVCGERKDGEQYLKLDFLTELQIMTRFMYYLVFPGKANDVRKEIEKAPSIERIRMAWNLNENMKITNLLTKVVSPFCSINMRINIPTNNENHFRSHVPAHFVSFTKLSKPADVCILHFHGGGMVANTPASHEKTIKSLSKKLNLPIISVDYALAPEHPHPAALIECYATYKWLVDGGAAHLGITGKRIIATGDSAGGYLAAAITLEAIMNKVQVPWKLMLVYPVMYRDMSSDLESHIHFQNDLVIPRSFRVIYNDAFIAKSDPRDPLISPLLASDNLLSQFPPTGIMVGELDPLIDDANLFANKLRKANVNVQMKVYEGFTHGFFSLGLLSKIEGQALADFANMLRELEEDSSVPLD